VGHTKRPWRPRRRHPRAEPAGHARSKQAEPSHRSRQSVDQENPARRPRIQELSKLPATPAAALRNHLATSHTDTTTRPTTTLGCVEPQIFVSSRRIWSSRRTAALRRRTAERDELKARLERAERPRAMSAAPCVNGHSSPTAGVLHPEDGDGRKRPPEQDARRAVRSRGQDLRRGSWRTSSSIQ
jgi:hypothetical protein